MIGVNENVLIAANRTPVNGVFEYQGNQYRKVSTVLDSKRGYMTQAVSVKNNIPVSFVLKRFVSVAA